MPIPCQMRPVTFVTRLRAALVLGALCPGAALLAGCGGSALESGARVVNIGEKDFAISAPRRLDAGEVELRVRNQGRTSHELIVVRAHGGLPLRSDGLTVDEEALRAVRSARSSRAPGATGRLRVHLRPGRYVLLQHGGHYIGGMDAAHEVGGDAGRSVPPVRRGRAGRSRRSS